jgi:hypothetical protein
MQPDRPVKLTFPTREPGARKIMAGKLQVGHALADHRMRWTAYLWAVAGKPGMGFRGEVKAADLRLMRAGVAGRLEANGPWWVLGDEERSEEGDE